MNLFRSVILAGAASALMAPQAEASIITTSTQTINYSQLLTDWSNRSGTFSLFDSNLGTLLSINLRATYQENSTLSVSNSASIASSGTVKTESTLTVAALDSGQNSVIQAQLGVPALDALGTQTSYSLAPGATQSGIISNSVTKNTGLVTDTTAADLVPFKAAGGGTGTILASTFTQSLLGNTGGNTSATQTTYGVGTFSIFYTYDDSTAVTPPTTPVPEPASMAIIGAGLLSAGLLRRRVR